MSDTTETENSLKAAPAPGRPDPTAKRESKGGRKRDLTSAPETPAEEPEAQPEPEVEAVAEAAPEGADVWGSIRSNRIQFAVDACPQCGKTEIHKGTQALEPGAVEAVPCGFAVQAAYRTGNGHAAYNQAVADLERYTVEMR